MCQILFNLQTSYAHYWHPILLLHVNTIQQVPYSKIYSLEYSFQVYSIHTMYKFCSGNETKPCFILDSACQQVLDSLRLNHNSLFLIVHVKQVEVWVQICNFHINLPLSCVHGLTQVETEFQRTHNVPCAHWAISIHFWVQTTQQLLVLCTAHHCIVTLTWVVSVTEAYMYEQESNCTCRQKFCGLESVVCH